MEGRHALPDPAGYVLPMSVLRPAPCGVLRPLLTPSFTRAEPPTVSLGKPIPPDAWTPLVDQSMPAEARTPFFSHWISSYFAHGDLSTRDPKAISYVVPSTARAPTIYGMSDAELARSVYEPSAFGSDMAFMIFSAPQIAATYHKAVFDKALRALVPRMRVVVFSGDSTASFSIPSQWAVEDDDKAAGGGFVAVKWIPGFNHLVRVSARSA